MKALGNQPSYVMKESIKWLCYLYFPSSSVQDRPVWKQQQKESACSKQEEGRSRRARVCMKTDRFHTRNRRAHIPSRPLEAVWASESTRDLFTIATSDSVSILSGIFTLCDSCLFSISISQKEFFSCLRPLNILTWTFLTCVSLSAEKWARDVWALAWFSASQSYQANLVSYQDVNKLDVVACVTTANAVSS